MRRIILIFSLLTQLVWHVAIVAQNRENINFNNDWLFRLGDITDFEKTNYDDTSWRQIDIPHDWSIEGNYSEKNPSGTHGAFLPTGIACYRKHFEYSPKWDSKKVTVIFDAIYCNSTIYINGQKLGFHPNGYLPIRYTLNQYLKPGENVIAVKVDHSKTPSGRWYTGSGIYRAARLQITEPVHLDETSLFVTTKDNREVTVKYELTGVNDKEASAYSMIVRIYNQDNREVAKKRLTHKEITNETTIKLKNPNTWSAQTPYLYTCEIELLKGKEAIDLHQTKFGFRHIEVSSTKGLWINGQKEILKGVCLHQDGGPVGTAVPRDLWLYRLKLLKEMGCNAVRTAHNPFQTDFYEICDSIGLYVVDEIFDGWETPKAEYDYGLYFEENWQNDLETFIKRDRNHPSILFWSIGNEVKKATPETEKKLYDFIKQYDTTRLITQGRSYNGKSVDIIGFNGKGEYLNALVKYHEKYPEKILLGTEMTHNYQTRGFYRTKTLYRLRDFPAPWELERKQSFEDIKNRIYHVEDLSPTEIFPDDNLVYQSSYDNSIVRMGIRDYWKATKDLPYYIGGFRWTGIDYLGESFQWPARTANFGVIDLANLPTDSYYLYQSLWSYTPMVHILPHWTHKVKEGTEIPVVVYTNCAEAELFLNGKSLGKKKMTDDLQIVWNVPYQPGELKVVATDSKKKTISKKVQTAGLPYRINLRTSHKVLSEKHNDAIIVFAEVVDENNVPVPYADNWIEFSSTEHLELIGVENGDVLDLTNNKIKARKAFHGQCIAIYKPVKKGNNVKIKATSLGLIGKEININIRE
ncbi:glycoside hydrolase family 2 protein [Labilibacter sediminis]|nr:glycoside hydrolase family 2 protein [Labilibacter sediminis]